MHEDWHIIFSAFVIKSVVLHKPRIRIYYEFTWFAITDKIKELHKYLVECRFDLVYSRMNKLMNEN